MVHLTLYKNLSERIKVDKNIQTLGTIEGTFREQADVLEPTLVIKGEFTNQCNYFYLQEFGRYYYVTRTIIIANGLLELHGAVDVLMSWKAGIEANGGIVGRQSTQYNLYLQDPLIHAYQNAMVGTLEFPEGFTTESYILATLA